MTLPSDDTTYRAPLTVWMAKLVPPGSGWKPDMPSPAGTVQIVVPSLHLTTLA